MKDLISGNLPLFVFSVAVAFVVCIVAMILFWRFLLVNQSVPKIGRWFFVATPLFLAVCALFFFSANIPYDDDYNTIVAYMARPWPERFMHLIDYNWEHRVGLTNLCAELMAFMTGRINFVLLDGIGLSFAFFVSIFFLKRLMVYGAEGFFAGVSIVWLLLSVISDYFFWPMASIQNNGVLFLAFAILILWRKHAKIYTVSAMILSIAATFTSGSGMIIWFIMAVMMWIRDDCRKNIKIQIIMLSLAVFSVIVYFHEPWVSQNLSKESFSLVRSFLYFFTFLGAWTCLPWVAVLAGFFVLGVLLCGLIRVNKLRHPEVFFLAAFIVANMLAGALFRSAQITNALPPRHSELSFALLGCATVLLFDQFPSSVTWRRVGVVFLCGYAVFVNFFSFCFFGKIWHDRIEIDRRNLLMRPYRIDALTSIHGPWHIQAIENLQSLESKGLYNSLWTRRKDEKPPVERIDPGDFWTPGRRLDP